MGKARRGTIKLRLVEWCDARAHEMGLVTSTPNAWVVGIKFW